LPLVFIGGLLEDGRAFRKKLFSFYLPLIVVLAALVGASLISPFGLALHRQALNISQSVQFRSLIHEWRPTYSPIFRESVPFRVFLFFLGVLVTVPVITRRLPLFPLPLLLA